jgi:hypothetical protein
MYVWERKANRNIVFTGGYKKNCRYLRFLKVVNKIVAGATFVMVAKVLVMVFCV